MKKKSEPQFRTCLTQTCAILGSDFYLQLFVCFVFSGGAAVTNKPVWRKCWHTMLYASRGPNTSQPPVHHAYSLLQTLLIMLLAPAPDSF